MKIKYQFVNNETTEIEISSEWEETILALDREESNSNRRETRRHISLEWHSQEDGEDFDSPYLVDPRADVPAEALRHMDARRLRAALEKLDPAQQKLVADIYLRGIPAADIARRTGVSKSAVSQRQMTALKNLRINLEKDP